MADTGPFPWETELLLDIDYAIKKENDASVSIEFDTSIDEFVVLVKPKETKPEILKKILDAENKKVANILEPAVKIIHWLGNSSVFFCQACNKNKLNTSNNDIWVVMKKTWDRFDPSFQRCTDSPGSWSPKTGTLIFINVPMQHTTSILDIRKEILSLITILPMNNRFSIELLQMWNRIETEDREPSQAAIIIQSKVKSLLTLTSIPQETRIALLSILKHAYLLLY